VAAGAVLLAVVLAMLWPGGPTAGQAMFAGVHEGMTVDEVERILKCEEQREDARPTWLADLQPTVIKAASGWTVEEFLYDLHGTNPDPAAGWMERTRARTFDSGDLLLVMFTKSGRVAGICLRGPEPLSAGGLVQIVWRKLGF
jgi:hypothetical protein